MRKLILSVMCVAMLGLQLFAQTKTLSGRVTDQDGNPLAGATVTAVEPSGTVKTSAVTTNANGQFSLVVPTNIRELQVSFVGYGTERKTIGTATNIQVSLTSTGKSLDEVVVTGYQTLRRSEVTGSIAKVSGEVLAQRPMGSFTNLLQGRATGVQVTGASGRPGTNAFIRIRGTGSINASSEPLIIVDGAAITTAAYNLINPNDIEDITVLKDASASSIYGSRAANGVLVVTTKKGRGRATLQYTFQYGQAKPQDLQNTRLMTAEEKLRYEYETNFTNAIIDSMITNRKNAGVFAATATLQTLTDAQRQDLWALAASRGAGDWRKILLNQNALTRTHEVSISGSSDKFRYFFSLNKGDNEGILATSFWNRTGGRLNVEFAATDWFKMGANIGVSNTEETQVREPNNTQNLYASTFYYNPYEPVFLANGRYNTTFQGFSSLEGAVNNPQKFNRIGTISTLFGEANFFKYLTLKTQLGINYNTFKEEYYIQPGSDLATILGLAGGQKRDGGNRDFLYTFTNTANWRQTIGTKHNVNILAGNEFTKDQFYSYSMTARGFPTASVTTLDNASTPFAATTSRSDWSLISYFGKASYNFEKKYYLDLSARRDGSSRFGQDNRFANFWAIGASWDVSNERFFTVKAINTLRLKASYGTAGNFNIGNYDALGTYRLNARYNDQPAAVPARLPNPELTWETNKNFDIGLEFGLFKNRITGTVDYYKRKTDDLLYDVNVSSTTGFSSYSGNIGAVENKGIEIFLSGDIIRNSNLSWNVSVSYTNNDNKVTELYSDNVPATLSRLVVGQPLNTYFLVRYGGVNPDNGKNRFIKLDGSLTEAYSASDAVLLEGKSPLVKYFGSIGTEVTFRSFDLSAQFYYSGGNYIMNYMLLNGTPNGSRRTTNHLIDAFDYWKKPGDQADYPNPLDPTQNQTFTTDRYLEKGDYITLRDLVLGYSLPANIGSKIKLKGLRVFVQGSNLWVGTKFKGTPEIGQPNSEVAFNQPGQFVLYGYPPMKAFTFGINVRF